MPCADGSFGSAMVARRRHNDYSGRYNGTTKFNSRNVETAVTIMTANLSNE